MRSLRDAISANEGTGTALWHFNFSELAAVKAAARLVRESGRPIVLGVSEGEREYVGVRTAAALVAAYRKEGIPLYLNADHTKSFEKIREAVEAGFDAVIFDGSALPFEENIAETKRVVEYIRMADSRIVIEGEVGYIGVSSKILDAVPTGIEKTSVEQAVRFVRETGVDMFAPAVGNIHGMLKGGHEPELDIALIRKIKEALRQDRGGPVPLVLHGASGNTDDDLRAAVEAGISLIHVNTELRVAWRKALDAAFAAHPEETTPYKLLESAEDAVYAVMRAKASL